MDVDPELERTDSDPIVVVGAGALGLVYCAMLAQSGQTVTLVASDRSFPRLVAAGWIELEGAVRVTVPMSVGAAPAAGEVRLARSGDIDRASGILFATKAHGLAVAARGLKNVTTGWVFGVQNGMGKDDILGAEFGRGAVLGGVSTLPGDRLDDHRVLLGSIDRTFVGELDRSPSSRVHSVVAAIERGGLSASAVADVRSVEWAKVMQSGAGHGVQVLDFSLGLLGDGTSGWQSQSKALARIAIVREIGDIAVAEGVEVHDYPPLYSRSDFERPVQEVMERRAQAAAAPSAAPSATRGSMHQDLDAGRQLETEELFGDLVERADRHGVSTPWLGLVLAAARTLNSRRTSG